MELKGKKRKKMNYKIPIKCNAAQLRMLLYAWTVQSILVNIYLQNQQQES